MIIIISGLLYALLIVWLGLGVFRHKSFPTKSQFEKISVIVAGKNEAVHLPNLLDRLLNQSYPENQYEVIFINDLSDDSTDQIVKSYLKYPYFTYLKVSDHLDQYPDQMIKGKKRALTIGIEKAQYEWLAFTDADCLPSLNWLNEINRHCSEKTDFIAGYSPLVFPVQNLITKLKNIERTSIFAVTAGSFGRKTALTCTARNMIYRKSFWKLANGYDGISLISSGDDDLMLLKMRKMIRNYNFMFSQDSIVPAVEDKNLLHQINQETRRASKFKLYPLYIKALTLFIFTFYLLYSLNFINSLIHRDFTIFLNTTIIKLCSEIFIITSFLHKIKDLRQLKYLPLAEIIYIPYFILFALKGTFGKYQWKK